MSADQVLEIPDFDARVEKERAKMAARKVETAKGHGGARDGAGRKAKDEDGNQVEHFDMKKAKRTGNNNASPERVIARLKRDAQTDPKAEALLQQVAGNNISARQATLLPAEHWPVNATIVALLVNSYRPLPTAKRYMRVASNRSRVTDLAQPSIRAALELLTEDKAANPS